MQSRWNRAGGRYVYIYAVYLPGRFVGQLELVDGRPSVNAAAVELVNDDGSERKIKGMNFER